MNASLDSRSLLASLQADFNRQFGALKPPVDPVLPALTAWLERGTPLADSLRENRVQARMQHLFHTDDAACEAAAREAIGAEFLSLMRAGDDYEAMRVLRDAMQTFLKRQAEESVERAFYGDKP